MILATDLYSRRQYTSQLEKWQCKKYQTWEIAHVDEIKPMSQFSSSPLAERMLLEDDTQITDISSSAEVEATTVEESADVFDNVNSRPKFLLEWNSKIPFELAQILDETGVGGNNYDILPLPSDHTGMDYEQSRTSRAMGVPEGQLLDKIRNAADFLLLSGCKEQAFSIYASQLATFRKDSHFSRLDGPGLDPNPEPGAWLSHFSLMGCVRSASTQAQLEHIRSELSLCLNKMNFSTTVENPTSLLTSDLADKKDSLNRFIAMTLMDDLDNRIRTKHTLVSWTAEDIPRKCLFLLEADAHTPSELQNKSVHLELYAILIRRSRSAIDRSNLEMAISLRLNPNRLAFPDDMDVIVRCMKWCESKLKENHNIVEIALIGQDKTDSQYIQVLSLFLALWKRWQLEVATLQFHENTLYWANTIHDSTFISATDVLLLVCGLIIESYWRLHDSTYSLGSRALRGIKHLLDVDSNGHMLIDIYNRLHQQRSSVSAAQFEVIYRSVISCLKKGMSLGEAELTDTFTTAIPNGGSDLQSNHIVSIPYENFAVSLDSKSYESFCKTHDQTKVRMMKLSSPQKMSWKHLSPKTNSMRSLQNSLNSMDLSESR